jgi:hypothetical protein
MTVHRINLQEADRDGVYPMLHRGRLIGLSSDPTEAGSRWLLKNGAKVGDGLEIYRTGAHFSYSLIRAEADPNPFPEEDPGGEQHEGDDKPNRPPKGKKTKKPEADDEDETAMNSLFAARPAAYEAAVQATAKQIVHMGKVRRGEVSPRPSPCGRCGG